MTFALSLHKGAMKTEYKLGAFERLPRRKKSLTTFNVSFTQICYIMRKMKNGEMTHQLLSQIIIMMHYSMLVQSAEAYKMEPKINAGYKNYLHLKFSAHSFFIGGKMVR